MMRESDRRTTIEAHAHLVPTTVARLGTHLQQADEDDLASALYVALVESVDIYNPAKGATMKTHLVGRLRFAVAEWFRNRGGVVSKTGWRTRNALARGEPVSPRQAQDLAAMQALERPLDLAGTLEEDGSTVADLIADPRPGPEQLTLDLFDRDEAHRQLSCLPSRERSAVRRYYLMDETHTEIGAALRVGKTQAAKLRAQGEARLKAWHGLGPMPTTSRAIDRVAVNITDADLTRRFGHHELAKIAEEIGTTRHNVAVSVRRIREFRGIRAGSLRTLKEDVRELAIADGILNTSTPYGWNTLAAEVLGANVEAVRDALCYARRQRGIRVNKR